MLTIGGFAFLLACVFGSYLLHGGSMKPLLASLPYEMLAIGGAGIGTFLMSNSMHDVKHTLAGLKKLGWQSWLLAKVLRYAPDALQEMTDEQDVGAASAGSGACAGPGAPTVPGVR